MKMVLVVDDDRMTVSALTAILEDEGLLVLAAHDGEEGLAIARRDRPDLVLTDLGMPRLDGPGLCRALKADPATSHIPVIVLSAASRLDPSAFGADAAVGKGADIDVMLEVVERYLADVSRDRR